jgi:hypothetical protein
MIKRVESRIVLDCSQNDEPIDFLDACFVILLSIFCLCSCNYVLY